LSLPLHYYLQPQLVPCKLVEFDHIISKAKLTEEDRFQDYVNPHTKFEVRLRTAFCDVMGMNTPAVRRHLLSYSSFSLPIGCNTAYPVCFLF
jgi:hypothetical protein